MEVKESHRQTEIGVIPEDWEVRTCEEICLKIQDGTHFSPSSGGNDYLYITSRNIGHGILDTSSAERIDALQHKKIFDRCDVRKGDLLLTKDGANTGNAAINDLDEEFSLLSSVAFLRFDLRKHDPSYYLQQVLSSDGQKRIKEGMVGNAITRLTLGKIRALRFPVPPLPEQTAIATVLSDIDTLINNLEKLIVKKRNIKKGAMQQLLTGRKRLPGFSGAWETNKLGKIIVAIGDGGTPSTNNPKNFGGTIPWVVIKDIKDEITTTIDTLTEQGLRSCSAKLWPPGTLILSTGATIGEIGIARVLLATKQGICGIVVEETQCDPLFLKYWIVYNKSLLLSKAQGSSIREVRAPTLIKFDIQLPQKPEQTVIADILLNIDIEISALEHKLSKYRLIKHGMMQELLTGKKRLI